MENLHGGTANLLRKVFNGGDSPWHDGKSVLDDVFLEEVSSQGMAPVLWHEIAASNCCADWPPTVLSGLRNLAMREAGAELLLEAELKNVLDRMAGIGVKPILLKGTPLSHTLYPARGMRPRCDTDLLIPESAREKVAALMKQLGYAGLYEVAADYISSQMSYSKRGKLNVLHSYDIHWRVSNNNREFSRDFAYDGLFADAVEVTALGENARTLNNSDALIFACFHRAGHLSHSGDRLIWLYDIHLLSELLSDDEASDFCDKARDLEIVKLCSDAVVSAQAWFGTRLSPALNLLLQEQPGDESSSVYLQSNGRLDGVKNNALLELKGLSTWRERLHFLLQNAFPPAEYMLWRYGKKQKAVLPWLYLKRVVEGIYIFIR